MADGVAVERHEGTPQGGPLSPLLANVLLDEVDKELERRGHAVVRYADDCNVYVRSRRAGERVMEALRGLYARLRLRINEDKSAPRRGSPIPGLLSADPRDPPQDSDTRRGAKAERCEPGRRLHGVVAAIRIVQLAGVSHARKSTGNRLRPVAVVAPACHPRCGDNGSEAAPRRRPSAAVPGPSSRHTLEPIQTYAATPAPITRPPSQPYQDARARARFR